MQFFSKLIDFILSHLNDIADQTLEHLWLTLISLTIATIIGLAIGILLSRNERFSSPVLGFVNVIQTIPSIALLGFMLPLLGIGALPAIVALFLYALLPIVRNTYTGIAEVEPSVREAAVGMGMSPWQILRKVELPLAVPVIFAGIRTATVINVGIATLTALIAAGGLGEFIFRGIAVNNVHMVLAGAIPASLLALALDFILGVIQKHIRKLIRPLLSIAIVGFIFMGWYYLEVNSEDKFRAGFPSEFIEREDGFVGLKEKYELNLPTVEMEIGLMYDALKNKKVDVISGFSTDGRIEAYDLKILEDNKDYFPPYHAAPTIRMATLNKYPELGNLFSRLEEEISNEEMVNMNYQVDHFKKSPEEVARNFLRREGFRISRNNVGDDDIVIGSKNFTENFILAELFGILIENYTNLVVDLRLGFGGTKLVFEALKKGDIDLYPEYTGTGLLVILKSEKKMDELKDKREVYQYVKKEYEKRYGITWLPPLGFNNTYALMMRWKQAEKLNIQTISDLKHYLDSLNI